VVPIRWDQNHLPFLTSVPNQNIGLIHRQSERRERDNGQSHAILDFLPGRRHEKADKLVELSFYVMIAH